MFRRVAYLCGAGIGGDDSLETRRESDRRLSVARAAIERQTVLACEAGDEIEQCVRIEGSVGSVERCPFREMILEIQARHGKRRAAAANPTWTRDSSFD